MRINRTKNASRNMTWGIINKITGLVIPFLCRMALINVFGVNYLGLNSLFTSLLNTLSLAELGFGSAIVYFMYEAISNDDDGRMCALMNYFKNVYRVIGSVITIIGVAFIPFLRVIIKSDIPDGINVYIVYLISLANSVSTYFLFAYKNCILDAYQRKDIWLKVNSALQLIERILQLFSVVILKNFYLYTAITLITNVLNNIIVARYVDRHYPQYVATGSIDREERKEIARKIKGIFYYKIGNVISGSADNVVISAFLGLTIGGIYGNYYYVVSMLFSIFGIYYNSIRAGIGNSLLVETEEKNYSDFRTLCVIQNWAVGWCTVCLLCLFQDFIVLYAGTENMLDNRFLVIMCLYFFVWKIQDVVCVYKEANGMWDTDRYRPIVAGLFNLAVNLILVQFIGIYGIVLSTIASILIVDFPWATQTFFANIFPRKKKKYLLDLLGGFLVTGIASGLTYCLCYFVRATLIVNLGLKFMVCLLVPNIVFCVFYYCCYRNEFTKVMRKLKQIVHR